MSYTYNTRPIMKHDNTMAKEKYVLPVCITRLIVIHQILCQSDNNIVDWEKDDEDINI